jgi:hypothetical protein
MSRSTPSKLRDRVAAAAEAALERQGYASAVDVLAGIGWLQPATLQRWRQGELPCLEAGMQTGPARIAEALQLLRAWVAEKGLEPSENVSVAKTVARQVLRFSRSGDEAAERLYRTHWLSRELLEKQRERIKEKASRPPELVVIQPLNDWTCHRCGKSGDLLIKEEPGPACLPCAGLGSLEYLPAGDALLTRHAKAKSRVYAVVVRFSRSRGRYERQGLLVEPEALRLARQEVAGRSGTK